MNRVEIKDKLKDIMALALGAKAQALLADCDESTNLVTDLGLNSVGILYIVVGIEEIFSISFEDVSFNDFKTVGDVVDYIEKNVV